MSEFGKKIRKKIRTSTGQKEPFTRGKGEEAEYEDKLDEVQKSESYEDMMERIKEESRGKMIPADKEEERDPEGPMKRMFKKMGLKF